MSIEKTTPSIQKMSIEKINISISRFQCTVTSDDSVMNEKDVIDYHNILERAAKHCITIIVIQCFAALSRIL